MIYNRQNGHVLIIDGNSLVYDGIRYDLPKRIWNRNGRSLVQAGNKVYVDEYVFKDGKFRWSFIGLFHKLF